ncbi:MAG: sortase [Clostridia bacterium]|nr:sortase [Clostridia bacterium]
MDSDNDLTINNLPDEAKEVPAAPSGPAYLRPAAPGVPARPENGEDRPQYHIPASPRPAGQGMSVRQTGAGRGTVPTRITQRDIFTDSSAAAGKTGPKPPTNTYRTSGEASRAAAQRQSGIIQRPAGDPQRMLPQDAGKQVQYGQRPAGGQQRTPPPIAGKQVQYGQRPAEGQQRTAQRARRNTQTSARNSYVPAARATANGRDTKKRRNPVSAFFASFLPWSGDTAKEGLRKIVMDFSALIIIACFVYFVNNYNDHKTQQAMRAEIQSMQEVENANEQALETRWLNIKAQYPDVNFPDGMNIRYASLYAKNSEFCGWISIPDTQVDYAVMHHPADADPNNEDEEDYYLHHDMEGNYSRYGEIYLDGSNSGAVLDTNNVIYGHNMTDGMLFAALEKYYTIEGFAESPIIKYSTIYEDYTFKVYAAFITNGYSTGDNGYLFNYVNTTFPSEDNFMKFVESINERRLYDTGVDIGPTDKLLTLSTCSYEISGGVMGRLAVIGRLVRPGETLGVDTSLAKKNPNPRYPQVWYDEHDMDNPYYGVASWTINS